MPARDLLTLIFLRVATQGVSMLIPVCFRIITDERFVLKRS